MLIPSKLSRPVRLDHTVVRERLLAKLSGANNFRLALITSPAGYGKTTLISQWAAGKNDIGWYSLLVILRLHGKLSQTPQNGHGIPCWILAVRPPLIKKSQMFSVKLMK